MISNFLMLVKGYGDEIVLDMEWSDLETQL